MKPKSFIKKLFFDGEVLERTTSLINGEILVTEDLFGNREMKVGGVTQSGGLVERLWRTTFSTIRNMAHEAQTCLILGLGAGTVSQLISERFPQCQSIGVEIDPVVIELGKKYFGLNDIQVLKVIKGDAMQYVKTQKSQFNLIIVDLYLGQEFPKEAESEIFLNSLKNILDTNGLIIFNRLNFGKHREGTAQFKEKLTNFFPHLISKEIYYNLLLFASLEAQKKV